MASTYALASIASIESGFRIISRMFSIMGFVLKFYTLPAVLLLHYVVLLFFSTVKRIFGFYCTPDGADMEWKLTGKMFT